MEIIPGVNISVDMILNIMVEITFVMLCVLSLIMVRQESLMDRVVSYSIGGSLKFMVMGFAFLCLLFTVLVLLF